MKLEALRKKIDHALDHARMTNMAVRNIYGKDQPALWNGAPLLEKDVDDFITLRDVGFFITRCSSPPAP